MTRVVMIQGLEYSAKGYCIMIAVKQNPARQHVWDNASNIHTYKYKHSHAHTHAHLYTHTHLHICLPI